MSWVRGRAAALALLASVMAAACGDASDLAASDTFATSSTTTTDAQDAPGSPTRGGPPPTPHTLPEPVDFDPIVPLPVTAATDRLVVSTLGDDEPPLLLIDLGQQEVVPLDDAEATRSDAVFSGEMLAYTIDDRTLGVIAIDDPDSVVRAALPDDVPGVISWLTADEEGFVAAVGVPRDPDNPYGQRDPGPYVLFGPDGDLRCVANGTMPSPSPIYLLAGVLWFDDLASTIDRTDCSIGPGLADLPDGSWLADIVDDDLLVGGLQTVAIYDATTGARQAVSERLGDVVSSVIFAEGAVWATVDGDVVELDAETLEVRHRAGPLDCVAYPYVLGGGGSVWLVDDCSGILAEVDPSTGDYVEAWFLPHDGESDQEVGAGVVGDGIWFVDVEQTGEPYRFDFAARRFERMPIPREQAETIYALVWQVAPGL